MKKYLAMILILIPNITFASETLNLIVTTEQTTTSQTINIISVDSTSFDANGVAQTKVLYVDKGKVYFSYQKGASCNYTYGIASISSDIQIKPNSSCGDKPIIQNW